MYFKNAVLGALFVALVSGCGKETSEVTQASSDASYALHHQELIAGRLKDPESATFRNVFVSRLSGTPLVCGEVNAKNSFGGYVGFQRFVSGGELQVIESDMAPSEMNKAWAQFCKR
jgi:hypothetical protein